jgi:ABC-type antimicrobial peptide transport system permease subunit
MAFIATRRRRELALRATMGARRADLLKQLVGEGARIVSAGLVGAAWATTMVFGLSATLADGLQRGLLGAALGMLALLCVAGLVGSALVARSVSMLSPREVLSET